MGKTQETEISVMRVKADAKNGTMSASCEAPIGSMWFDSAEEKIDFRNRTQGTGVETLATDKEQLLEIATELDATPRRRDITARMKEDRTMKFLVHYVGGGDGCDWAVGCNETATFIEADDLSHAVELVTQGLASYPDDDGADIDPENLSRVYVYVLAGESASINLKSIQLEIKTKRDQQRNARREKEARKEYERLKVRFGEAGGKR